MATDEQVLILKAQIDFLAEHLALSYGGAIGRHLSTYEVDIELDDRDAWKMASEIYAEAAIIEDPYERGQKIKEIKIRYETEEGEVIDETKEEG